MSITRRRFLATVAGTASLCLADGPALCGLATFGAETPPERIRFGPDLEPIVRLIEETPREQCVRVFVAELRRGLPYRRFLAASLFASIRRARSHHEVYKIHAVHQVGTTSMGSGAPITRSSSRYGKRCRTADRVGRK